ncbi:MAG: vWA domain-containing protein [Gammaproteobacteria bacterium]
MIRITLLLAAMMTSFSCSVAASSSDILLVIDNSGSMKTNDPEFLTRKTVAQFVGELEATERAGLLLFGTQARLVNRLTTPHQLTAAINQGALTKIDFSDQWTDTAAALEMALYEQKMNGRPDANPVIVILTDGIVDTGNKEDSKRRREWIINGLSQQATQSGVRIFAIAFTETADFELLQSLAQRTGGDYYRILSAQDMPTVFSKIHSAISVETFHPGLAPAGDEPIDFLAEFADDFETGDEPSIEPAENLAVAEPSATEEAIPVFSGRKDAPDAEMAHPLQPSADKTAGSPPADHRADTGGSARVLLLVLLLVASGGFILWRWFNTPKKDRRADEALLHEVNKETGQAVFDVTGMVTRIGRSPGRGQWCQRPN